MQTQSETFLDLPALPWPGQPMPAEFECSRVSDSSWCQGKQKNCPAESCLNSWQEKIINCYKSLSFGLFCFIAIDNRNWENRKCKKKIIWRYSKEKKRNKSGVIEEGEKKREELTTVQKYECTEGNVNTS